MLPKKYRLNLAKEKFRQGDKQVSNDLFKLMSKTRRNDGPKVGFIVSSKVGGAVVRNRIKRYLSEAVEESANKIPKDCSLIFIAFPKLAKVSRGEILNKVSSEITKIC